MGVSDNNYKNAIITKPMFRTKTIFDIFMEIITMR